MRCPVDIIGPGVHRVLANGHWAVRLGIGFAGLQRPVTGGRSLETRADGAGLAHRVWSWSTARPAPHPRPPRLGLQ